MRAVVATPESTIVSFFFALSDGADLALSDCIWAEWSCAKAGIATTAQILSASKDADREKRDTAHLRGTNLSTLSAG
jgi:hypothetical protein